MIPRILAVLRSLLGDVVPDNGRRLLAPPDDYGYVPTPIYAALRRDQDDFLRAVTDLAYVETVADPRDRRGMG